MNLKKLQKKQIIIVSIILLALFIAYFLIYKPLMGKKETLLLKLAEAKQKSQIFSIINGLNSKKDAYTKRISRPKDEGWLINEISDAANKADVRIISIEPQQKDYLQNYVKLSARVKAEADFHKLGKFLSILENSQKILKIDFMQISTEKTFELLKPEEEIFTKGVPVINMIVSAYTKRF